MSVSVNTNVKSNTNNSNINSNTIKQKQQEINSRMLPKKLKNLLIFTESCKTFDLTKLKNLSLITIFATFPEDELVVKLPEDKILDTQYVGETKQSNNMFNYLKSSLLLLKERNFFKRIVCKKMFIECPIIKIN